MRFSTTLHEAATRRKEGHRRRKTSLHLQDDQPAPRQRLSKFYGYKLGENGKLEIVPEEAGTVRLVFRRIMEGRSVDEIRVELDLRNLRTRFGNRWTVRNLKSLVLHYPWDIHPVVISPAVYHKAVGVLKRMQESAFDPTTFFRG